MYSRRGLDLRVSKGRYGPYPHVTLSCHTAVVGLCHIRRSPAMPVPTPYRRPSMFAKVPISVYRPENVIGHVIIDAEFVPALKLLNLDWWYRGDPRRAKKDNGYVTFRRSVPREWVMKAARSPMSKSYNLSLHRVIGVGIAYGSIPASWPELIMKCESIGVIEVTDQWDYTKGKLIVSRGTAQSNRVSNGAEIVETNPLEERPRLQEIRTISSVLNDSWDEGHLPASMFPQTELLPTGSGSTSTLSEEEEERRAWQTRLDDQAKEEQELLDKLSR
jgi:hypothetical protein